MTKLDWEKARRHDARVAKPLEGKQPRRKTAVWKGPYRIMFARYPGRCHICGGAIEVGQGMGHHREDHVAAHVHCLNARITERRPAHCFICGRPLDETSTVVNRRGANRHIHQACAGP